jgi:hypothetical protein
MTMTLKPQEIPADHKHASWMFQTSESCPAVATPAAIDLYGIATIAACLMQLQQRAVYRNGLDYLQVFENLHKPTPLWFIQNDESITALLPSDY